MAKRRKRNSRTISLVVGNDPSLWRFASMEEALAESTDLLAQLIHESASRTENTIPDTDQTEICEVERT